MPMPLGSTALPLSLGVSLYLLYQGSLTRTIWLSLNVLDTLRALRLIRPNGRAVGQVTRRKAMRQALITWIVFVAGQSVGSIPDRLLGWLPLYGTVKIIVLCGFLATRVISSTSIYRSLLVPLLRKYQTPIDLSLLLIHSILALGVHYLLWIPLDIVRSVSRRVVVLSAGFSRTLRPVVMVLVSVPLIRRSGGKESKTEVEVERETEMGPQRVGGGGGDGAAGDGSAGTAPELANLDDEPLRRWLTLTPGPAIPGRLLRSVRSVQPRLPIARTESGSESNLGHGENQDQIPEQARGVMTVSEVSVEVDGLPHAGPSTVASASTPARPEAGGTTLAVPVVPTLRRSPRLQRTQAAHVNRHDDTRSTRIIPPRTERSNVIKMFHAVNHPDPSSSEDSEDVRHPLPKVGQGRSRPAPRVPSLKSVNVAHNHFSLDSKLADPKHPASISVISPTFKESVLANGDANGDANANAHGNGNGKAKDPLARMNRGKSRIGATSQSMTLGGALQVHSAPTVGRQGIASKRKGPGPGPGPQRSNSVVLPVRPLPRSTSNTTLTKPSIYSPIFNPGSTEDGAPARSTSAQRVAPLPSLPPQEQSRGGPPPAPSQASFIAVTAKARSVRSTTRSIILSDDVPRSGVISATSRVRAAREAAKRGVGGVGADKDPETATVPGKRVAGKFEDERERRKRLRVGE